MIDKRVLKFIGRHHVMTLATVSQSCEPYCCNVFYSFDAQRGVLIFASSEETQHCQQMLKRDVVAASIVLESRVVGKLQGLQLTGRVTRAEAEDRSSYIAAFPYAAVVPLTLWRFEIDFMKLTDNRLGFGKKLIWKRE